MPTKKSLNKTAKTFEKADEFPKADYLELIAEDPNFHRGSTKFEFPNGDKYEGEFCAHVSGAIWRQGKGIYTTKDGHIYVGEWDGDALVENKDVEITYQDGSKYFGALVKSKYTGPAVYQLQENLSLTCLFSENKPKGEISLIDPNNKIWHGFAEKDESLFIQEHPFYFSLGKDLGKGKCKKITPKDDSIDSKTSLKKSQSKMKFFNRDKEKEIFAKSKKTIQDLDFEQSSWYTDYKTFCNNYEGIITKAKATGETSLNKNEFQWYKNYKEFERNCKKLLDEHKFPLMKKPQGDPKLFQLIHSEEYKILNKPVKVFYPTKNNDKIN